MASLLDQLQSAQAAGLARIDAQMLLLHACGRDPLDRAWLAAHASDALSPEQLGAWQDAFARRLSGEPVAYLLGFKEFYGLRLKVDAGVLDPRDDTETLVDWALELVPKDRPFKVLDLGTGSGAIALAIKSQRPLAQVSATDASPAALAVAQANSQALGLPVRFVLADVQSPDWFSCLQGERFDLIVSNPPYIAEGDAHLAALRHEPAMALTSGQDGLDAIRSIASHAPEHLTAGGWLLFEHGYDQARVTTELLRGRGFEQAASRPDLAGVDRCSGGLWPIPEAA
jgi:release factor glutamine methyltransferase